MFCSKTSLLADLPTGCEEVSLLDKIPTWAHVDQTHWLRQPFAPQAPKKPLSGPGIWDCVGPGHSHLPLMFELSCCCSLTVG